MDMFDFDANEARIRSERRREPKVSLAERVKISLLEAINSGASSELIRPSKEEDAGELWRIVQELEEKGFKVKFLDTHPDTPYFLLIEW